MYWMVSKVQGVRYGHKTSYSWLKSGVSSYDAIFDSGTSLTMVPEPLYEYFMDKLLEQVSQDLKLEQQQGIYFADCSLASKLPAVEFLVGDHWLQISTADYLLKSTEDPTQCVIGFIPSITNFFVFGDTLMRGYYTIHSDDDNMIGIAPHRNSPK